jgi:steroid 5-alpha reductase family enzyme
VAVGVAPGEAPALDLAVAARVAQRSLTRVRRRSPRMMLAPMSPRARAFAVCGCVYAVAIAVGYAVARWSGLASPWDAAAGDAAATIAVFACSAAFSCSSLYDPYWSVAPPALLIWFADEPSPRVLLAGALVFAWAVRLTWNFLNGWRSLAHEDWRYRDLRAKSGRAYWLVSFLGIHFFPTVLTFAGSLSLWVVARSDAPLSWVDVLAAIVTLGAIAIETIADAQLARFVASKPDPERFLDSGLWRYSRHPNYFGEVGFWWGLFLFAVAADAERAWVVVGPVAITLLFVFVSIPLIDRRMAARRPLYAAHMKKVSALVPMPR